MAWKGDGRVVSYKDDLGFGLVLVEIGNGDS